MINIKMGNRYSVWEFMVGKWGLNFGKIANFNFSKKGANKLPLRFKKITPPDNSALIPPILRDG